MVYHPHEDSYFLADFVKLHARGRVLDMCCGSGVQTFAAIQNKKVKTVKAVDIDPDAITVVEESPYDVTVVQSDLFAGLGKEQFDTIVCNPPYLPKDKGIEDPALYGGQNGYEFTERFLQEAIPYLASQGNILLLFSSLTNKERIDLTIKKLGYHYEQLGELAMFFERLYVYRLWR